MDYTLCTKIIPGADLLSSHARKGLIPEEYKAYDENGQLILGLTK